LESVPPTTEWLTDLAIVAIVTMANVGLMFALAQGRLAPWLIRPGTQVARAALIRQTRQIGPALAAAFVTFGHTQRPSTALFVLVTVLLVGMSSAPTPLRLMPVARLGYLVALPLFGTAVLALAVALGFVTLGRSALLAELGSVFAAMAFSSWLEDAFDRRRPQRVAILGGGRLAAPLAADLIASGVRGYRFVGYLGDTDESEPGDERRWWISDTAEIVRSVIDQRVDALVLAPGRHAIEVIRQAVDCLQADVRILDASTFYEEVHGRVPVGVIDAAWLGQLARPRPSVLFAACKRAVDLGVVVVALPVLAPCLVVVAVTIAITDGRPILYRQRRVGERGREFDLLKFRTMSVDAEQDGSPVWAAADDPRVTRFGHLLRRSHIDEFPQLINVLRGAMSIVGPRPERPQFVVQLAARYPFYRPRQIVKPGITGWAQIRCGYAGSDAGSGHKLCNDLFYIKHRSLLLDFLIMIETLRTLVRNRPYDALTHSEAFAISKGPHVYAVPDSTAAAMNGSAAATVGAKPPVISVVVPVLNEARQIRDVLASMSAQEFDEPVEFLLIDGGSDDGTRELIAEHSVGDPRFRLLDNSARRTPQALNIGLAAARGEFVARMDAHAFYPPGYLASGVERLRRNDVAWASGPALPRGVGTWGSAIAAALGSPLGVGGSGFRVLRAAETEVDTGFVGILRASTLRGLGGWDEGWPVNQDAELAARVRAASGRIVCLPEMAASVVPRDSPTALARQYWRYGLYRVKTARRHPRSLRPSHLLPPALLIVLGLAAAGPASLRRPARAAATAYATALGAESVGRNSDDLAVMARVPAVLAIMHLSWGAGFLAGSVRFGPPLRAAGISARVVLHRSATAGARRVRS
jgi:succinoglycan biosynthesis protein ExoA